MLGLQNQRVLLLFDKITSDTSTTNAGNAIDTLNYDEVKILFWEECTAANTTTAAKVLQLEESDDATTYATFAGGRGGTDFTCVAVPSATQSDIQYAFSVSCVGRKRYLRLKWTPGETGQTAFGVALLGRGKVAPDTTTEMNVAKIVNC